VTNLHTKHIYFMQEARIVEVALVWMMCGVLVAFFFLVKLGAGPAILGGQEAIPQRQMVEAEVDHATVGEQHRALLESRVPASKVDTPE
jgi:hypothetical protein